MEWRFLILIAMSFVLRETTQQCSSICFGPPCPCACLVEFCGGSGTGTEIKLGDVELTARCNNSGAEAHWNPGSLSGQVNDDGSTTNFNLDYVCYNLSSSNVQEITHDSFGGRFEEGSAIVHPSLPAGENIFCTFNGCVINKTGCWVYLEDETDCLLGPPKEVTSTTQLTSTMSLTQPSLSSSIAVSTTSTLSVSTTTQLTPPTVPSGGFGVIPAIVVVISVIVILVTLISIATVCLTLRHNSRKNWMTAFSGNSRLLSEPSGIKNAYTVVPFDRISVASSVVTILHPLDYKDVSNGSHLRAEKSDFTSVSTEKVIEELADCSADSDSATEKYIGQSPPQYLEASAEDGYTYIDANIATKPTEPLQPLELACSPSHSFGYVTTKESAFFDNHMPSKEFPVEITEQYYNDDYDENTTNISSPFNNNFRQEYVQADFSVSDSRHIMHSEEKLQDFDENRSESSPLDYLCNGLVFSEEMSPFSQGSCSATEKIFHMTPPPEHNEQVIRHEENNSPRLTSSDSECGYIQFQSIVQLDSPLHLISEQERHSHPSERNVFTASSVLDQHQSRTGSSMDDYLDSPFVKDYELHSNRSKQLVRLSKFHGSVSSIDSGYVRTYDFD